MTRTEQITAWHAAGIHLECDPRVCRLAGRVERFHHHDFDGPLPDCCPAED